MRSVATVLATTVMFLLVPEAGSQWLFKARTGYEQSRDRCLVPADLAHLCTSTTGAPDGAALRRHRR